MKIPYSIIKKFVPKLKQSPQELADLITFKSYEVDSVYNIGENLKNIVVGHVQKVTQHPNADKLHIAEVLVDNNEVLTIVCGAKNIELGQKVAVARIGAVLPNGTSIQKVNIRGQDSYGMICSSQELGLDEKSDGIFVLPQNAIIGSSISDALDLNDTIIDIDNKGLGTRASDSSSFYGISREVALITKNDIQPLEISSINNQKALRKNIKLETHLCKYYSLLEVSGLSHYKFDSNILSKGTYRVDLYVQTDILKLDSEIYRVLSILNQKSHHPAVDLGNYILFETGQPVHVFDAEKVKGRDIVIREAKKGETFIALGETEILLEKGDIVICDSESIIALAGIIGGASTAVDDGTKSVLIESASFDNEKIRQTARRLKLLTESAKRFERQIPTELANIAVQRIINIAKNLKLEILGYGNKGNSTSSSKLIQLNYNYVRNYIGADISDNEINILLKELQIDVHKTFSSNLYSLKSPYWRLDLNSQEDYIEEIARLYGYDKIPTKLDLINLRIAPNDIFNFKRELSESLTKIGYNEIITYPYTSEGELILINPVDESKPYLRTSLIQAMNNAIKVNSKYKDKLKLFEISNVFSSEENLYLSISCWDKVQDNSTSLNKVYKDLLIIIAQLGYDFSKFLIKNIDNQNEIYYDNTLVGWSDSIVIEINLSVLISCITKIKEYYVSIPKYPSLKRDITLQVPVSNSIQEVYSKIHSLVSKRCYYIGFRDKFINGDTINYTFHLEFRDLSKSLSDDEVNLEIDSIHKYFAN